MEIFLHLQNSWIQGGWRAPSRQLWVEDEAMPGRRLVEREIEAGAGSVLLEGFLQEEKTYILTFSPTGPRVPQDIGQVGVVHFLSFCNGHESRRE